MPRHKKSLAELQKMARKGGQVTRARHPNHLREIAAMGGRASAGVPKKRKPKQTFVQAYNEHAPKGRLRQIVLEQVLGELNA